MSCLGWLGLYMIKSTIANGPCQMSVDTESFGAFTQNATWFCTLPQFKHQQCVSFEATHGIKLEYCNQVGL